MLGHRAPTLSSLLPRLPTIGVFCGLLLPGILLEPSFGEEQKPGKTPPPVAIIAGTVFRDPGFALAGAKIRLEPMPEAATSDSVEGQSREKPKVKVKVKVKKMEVVSDRRGEFAFRVPPVSMRYNLNITAAGHLPEQREVIVAGEGRQDVYVTLKPAP